MMEASGFELRRRETILRGVSVGRGPSVLFLHAGKERRQVWDPVMAELRRSTDLRCVAYDQRGHGESTGRASTIAPFAEDASAVLTWIGAPTVLVGASLGGLAALAAAAEASPGHRILGLVLVDIVPDPDPVPVWAFLKQEGLLPEAAGLAHDLFARGDELRQAVADFPGHVMLARAGRSALTDADLQRFLTYCPEAEVEDFPDATHLVARDVPAALGAALGRRLPRWLS